MEPATKVTRVIRHIRPGIRSSDCSKPSSEIPKQRILKKTLRNFLVSFMVFQKKGQAREIVKGDSGSKVTISTGLRVLVKRERKEWWWVEDAG